MTQPPYPPQQPDWRGQPQQGQYPPPHGYGPPTGQYQGSQGYGPPPQYGPPQHQTGQHPTGQQPYPSPPPKKKRTGLKVFGGIVASMFIIGSCNNALRGDDTTTAVTDTGSAAVPAAAAPAAPGVADNPNGPAVAQPPAFPGAQPGDLATDPGGTLTLDGLTITAAALEEGDNTFNETLCTTATYTNGSSTPASYGVFDWSLQNPGGAIVNITFFGGDDNHLGSGELAPGGSVTGTLCFEDQNPAAGQYVLLYDSPSWFDAGRGAWLNPR